MKVVLPTQDFGFFSLSKYFDWNHYSYREIFRKLQKLKCLNPDREKKTVCETFHFLEILLVLRKKGFVSSTLS